MVFLSRISSRRIPGVHVVKRAQSTGNWLQRVFWVDGIGKNFKPIQKNRIGRFKTIILKSGRAQKSGPAPKFPGKIQREICFLVEKADNGGN